jgi:SAM-dependent methyltransferase
MRQASGSSESKPLGRERPFDDGAPAFGHTVAIGAPIEWPVPDQLVSSPATAYRNMFAMELAKRDLEPLVASYVYLSTKQMGRMVRLAARHLGVRFSGVGIDLGAGCGLLGATVAAYPAVQSVLAVEVCEEMARRVIPKVAAGVLGDRREKLKAVFGSFDDLRLPSNSVDFIVEIDSLHHSDNLAATLTECRRVLKGGGFMLAFDRCHANLVTDHEIEQMLSTVYSQRFLAYNCYPPDITLTRRDNGEHEYRLFEWQAAFQRAELKLEHAHRFTAEIRSALALKGCMQILPAFIRRRLYKSENADFGTAVNWVTQYCKLPFQKSEFGRPILAPKDTTVFLLRKA